MEKNGIYQGEVKALGTEGEGIIEAEGTTAFVPFCLTGEKVSFKALKVKGNIAYGKLLKVLSPSPARVKPVCPVFEKCGGCSLQHMDYPLQLEFKRGTVERALKKIGGITAGVSGTVPCGKPYRYRNKLALPIGVDNEGNTVCGFYAPRSHRILPVEDCPIQSDWVRDIIKITLDFAEKSGYNGYDEVTRRGELRRIVVREVNGKFIIALVAVKKINVNPLISAIERVFKDFTLLLNVNPSQGNAIFGEEWHICRGEGWFEAEESGIKFRVGANTFMQVNDDVRSKLYAAVLDEVEEGEAALDIYSGGGMLTAMLAKKCGLAYGVEIVEEASRHADELKTLNGLQGKMFNICGDAEEKIGEVLKKTEGKRRVLVCDPPRKGMARSVVNAAASSGAEKIILISCNPATLARDAGIILKTLKEQNGELVKADGTGAEYKIKSVTPFDMFPQSFWCETLMVLTRIK